MKFKNYLKVLLLTVSCIVFNATKTYSQQIYATTAMELSTGDHVDDEVNATADNGNFATVNSFGGVLAGIGSYAGHLKLEFPSLVPANTTTYIHVGDGNTDLFDMLLGGSLGELLSNTVGTIALGDHYIEVAALNALGTSVVSGRSDNLTSSGVLKVVRNKNGEIFFAITPTVAYKSVTVKDVTDALLLGSSNFINVFNAFYLDPANISCISEGIFTWYDGTGITLGLLDPTGLLGTTGVANPEFAIDNDDSTFSKINIGIVSALATMYQDIQYPTIASITDQLEINIRGVEGALVNVAVLQNINIDLYNKGTIVYSTTADAANMMALLPSADGAIRKIAITPGVEFDRLRVTLVSPVGMNLAQQVDLFGTKVTPAPPTLNPGEENQSFCTIQNAKISDIVATVATGTVVWYNQETGGVAYANTDPLVDGNIYYGATLNGSCESTTRVAVTVVIADSATPTTLNDTQNFCAINNPKISDISVDVLAGAITWYDSAVNGTAYDATNPLTDGTYYAANTVGSCESSIRLEVTVTVQNPEKPTTTDNTPAFCAVDAPTIANLNATASGTIIWYNQATGGTAYAATDALTNGLKYYATNSNGTCESSTRLEVTVQISDTGTPTTTDTTQSFCTIDAPTIANLNAAASGTIIWYNQATGGTAYATTDDLTNGLKYYATNSDGTCESSKRLEITVQIADPETPTTTDPTQNFCVVNAPTIADISATVSAGTIIWYDAAVAGNAYASNDALTNGKYYAANSVGTCESSARLEVTVTISDTTTPTTTNNAQTFCAIDAPTIANLDASASGTIIWYDKTTGGTAYAATDALTSGKYYAANSDGTCESSNRLEVTATVQNPTTPTTTDTNQSFCAIDAPTIANLKATASGTIIWYNLATGGTAYAATDALISGKYYAANSNGTCESSTRLEITVTVSDPTTPTTTNINQSFCAIDTPTIANLNASASGTIIWYDQATGGTSYASADVLVDGQKYYAANLDRGCEGSTRLEITVTVSNPATPTTTNTNQNFCAIDAPTIANLKATASGTIIWYDQATGGTAYVSTDALADGQKYYAANSDGTCESSTRLEITVTVSDPTTPTTTSINQSFCAIDAPTITNLKATASGTIIWYDQATGGTAYTATDVLISGKYYATNSDGTCESSMRLEVTVTVSNPATPTTTNTNQKFCTIDAPTVADLKASASGTIIWYDQATGGTAYASSDALTNGKYYAANSDGTCESSARLEVTATVTDTATPTTINTNQSFCTIDAPTVANLKATVASGTIIWYNQATGGTAYASTDALVDGQKYYASNSNGTCESSIRLEVTVTISDSATPTTTNANQTFCSVNNPIMSDLNATATGTMTWYNQATGGTAHTPTDALVDGQKYYASNSDGTCESSKRLEVTATVTTAPDITIQGKNTDVCFGTAETYNVPAGYAPYTWNITGGTILSGGTTNDNTIEIEWTNLTNTKVSVNLTGGCFNSNSVEQPIGVATCSDLTIKKEVDFIEPNVEDVITFTVEVKNSALSEFTDLNVSEILTDGFTYVSSNTTLGSYNENTGIWNIPTFGANQSATLTIKAKVNASGDYLNTATINSSTPEDADTTNNTAQLLVKPTCLKVYNIITPNGDGINDSLIISCIGNYKDTDLRIFDRYGSIIYKMKNYNNDWSGIANQTSKIIKTGQTLPNGTYFYVLKFNDGSANTKKGWIQITK